LISPLSSVPSGIAAKSARSGNFSRTARRHAELEVDLGRHERVLRVDVAVRVLVERQARDLDAVFLGEHLGDHRLLALAAAKNFGAPRSDPPHRSAA
jgi:hypothetical protein